MRERERGGKPREYGVFENGWDICEIGGGTGGKTESKGFGIQNDWVLL